MIDEPSRIERVMDHIPSDRRVVADTIRACAASAFAERWPDAAEDMAAVVCGRWLHSVLATDNDKTVSSATPNVDRVVNECFARLDDEQIAATERMFDELSGCWRDL